MNWLSLRASTGRRASRLQSGHSIFEHAFILQNLAKKHTSKPDSSLDTAFIDFRSAFHLVPRERLLSKLLRTTIDRHLILLIHNLYKNQGNVQDHCTNQILNYRGIRQGFIIAPLLFILNINPLVVHLNQLEHHSLKLVDRHIASFLYVDDIVLLLQTQIELKSASYSSEEAFEINYSSIKMIIFAKCPKLHTWKINGQNIEQVKSFKYWARFPIALLNIVHIKTILSKMPPKQW